MFTKLYAFLEKWTQMNSIYRKKQWQTLIFLLCQAILLYVLYVLYLIYFNSICGLFEKVIFGTAVTKFAAIVGMIQKILFSSLESLISLMREVELLEKVIEQANMIAARGGSDILERVKDYQDMLVNAKEANDMHAGEINGEKAIGFKGVKSDVELFGTVLDFQSLASDLTCHLSLWTHV